MPKITPGAAAQNLTGLRRKLAKTFIDVEFTITKYSINANDLGTIFNVSSQYAYKISRMVGSGQYPAWYTRQVVELIKSDYKWFAGGMSANNNAIVNELIDFHKLSTDVKEIEFAKCNPYHTLASQPKSRYTKLLFPQPFLAQSPRHAWFLTSIMIFGTFREQLAVDNPILYMDLITELNLYSKFGIITQYGEGGTKHIYREYDSSRLAPTLV